MIQFKRRVAVLMLILLQVLAYADDETAVNDQSTGRVYVIPLRENVDRYLGVFVGRMMEQAQRAGAEMIILEIDTFGGRVDTALEIASRIGAASKIRTVAYVPADSGGRGVSWSAGALMAFAASEIWMAPGTSIGAAAPVIQTAEGSQGAGEKAVSAVRGQMAALAEKNGYPIGAALAMVDADVELKEIVVDGELTLATGEDIKAYERLGREVQVGRTISTPGKLLTLTAGEMERYGISSGTVTDRNELLNRVGYTPADAVIVAKKPSDRILSLLTSGAMTSLLLLVALVTLYLEITTPGFGIPGTVALVCFAIVFVSSGLMGNLGPAEILMFLSGIVLLLLEVFIIPGFGVAGIGGILLVLLSFVFSRQSFYLPQFEWQWSLIGRNFGIVGIGTVGGFILIGVLMSVLPRGGILDPLVLHEPGDPGYGGMGRRTREGRREGRAAPVAVSSPQPDVEKRRAVVTRGDLGIVVTDLRPVGKVRFGNFSVVCETEGEYCGKGTEIVVQYVDGVKTVVAALEEA